MNRIEEPVHDTVDCLAGIFSYVKPDGTPEQAEFYVRTEPAPAEDNPDYFQVKERRQDALNAQTVEVWNTLRSEGYTSIKLTDTKPDPFF